MSLTTSMQQPAPSRFPRSALEHERARSRPFARGFARGFARPIARGSIWLLGWIVCSALITALPAPSAHAHTRSLSHSSWQLSAEGAQVKVRIPRLELTRVGLDAPPSDARLRAEAGDYLASRLQLVALDGTACTRDSELKQRSAREGWASYSWNYHCAGGAPAKIQTRILLEAAPSHLHFARVSGGDGPARDRIVERVLTEESPAMPLLGDASPAGASGAEPSGGSLSASGSSVGHYIAIGIEHILTGWDHVAFVLALLLLATRLGEVARLVTGFTIAHSVTLALAVLGVVRPIPSAVEAIIGFSVALVAVESAWTLGGRPRGVAVVCVGAVALVALAALAGLGALPPLSAVGLLLFTACYFALLERVANPTASASLRAALAFAFGLVHGFGFAGILGEMQLPESRLVPALFGFNVGVELGQLGIVALAWPALRALRTLGDGRVHRLVLDASCACICALGLFWFVSRSFGA